MPIISHSLLFHEKSHTSLNFVPFSPYFLDRPLEKEKVIPLVTCFIESLFMTVDTGNFGKGELQSYLFSNLSRLA